MNYSEHEQRQLDQQSGAEMDRRPGHSKLVYDKALRTIVTVRNQMAGAGYYKINIDVWPHSTGEGGEKDRAACGPATQGYNIHANDFSHAVEQAKLLAKGIEANPRVWQAPIASVAFVQTL